ncbi:SPOR domain-containing protein [Colwellia piezophila]|uniref:SPOR domain-containing protein n=1 Tax=Colwellia piezophila TaxID=211668 RepID=UPI000369D386|nr:SPOR domain-containing protein [Colwellia piezophila]
MSTPFQNRLVGTIIVAAVVIIFLPDVLDGEKQSYQADFEAIPRAEVFSGRLANKPFPEDKLSPQKTIPISNEQAIDAVIKAQDNDSKAKETSQVTITKPKHKPPVTVVSATKKKLPEKAIAKEAWVIHLGSFRDKSNVEQLLKKLRANGYIVFTKPIKTKQGTLTKVIIGPELIKSVMIKKIPALKKLTDIQGKIASFEPKK